KANDASTTERARRMLNITRATGEFLAVLVRATLARRVLEIGTSNGYSTLWLGECRSRDRGLRYDGLGSGAQDRGRRDKLHTRPSHSLHLDRSRRRRPCARTLSR